MRKGDSSHSDTRLAPSLILPILLPLLLLGAAMFVGCHSATGRPTKAKPIIVKLVAFNDFHGHLNPHGATLPAVDPQAPGNRFDLPAGGIAYLATLISQLKASNPLTTVVAAGDMIGGAPLVSSLFHHEPSIEVLNRIGLEFSSVGNHEFDAGRAELLRIQKGGCFAGAVADTCRNGVFAGAQFRYLAANVIDRTTDKSFLPGYAIKKYAVAGGRSVEIAFIGLVLKGTPSLVMPSGIEGLDFIDEADAANALVPELRARGIESIGVLIHEGGYTTQTAFDDATCPDFKGPILRIMDRLDPAIDVVISGHTHRAYVCRHGGRLVTSAGSEGRIVTDIDLTIDAKSGNIASASARQLAVVNDTALNPLPSDYPTVAADERLLSILNLYNSAAAPLAQREVGRITQEMPRAPAPSGESMLGDVIADAQLAATRERGLGGSQIAFMNGGGIRTDLRGRNGHVSYNDAFSIHPFGNGLITLSLSGAQIDTLLEQQWSHSENQLQVSRGFSYEWNAAAPLGRRVDIGSIRLNGVAIDPVKTYRVTVNEFLAQGGDGYSVLIDGTERIRGVTDVQALTEYLAENSPLAPPAIDRIRRLN
ncbi:MAG: bifunctional metallophosphatase/5'-nucleotidase [Steroidobacteraceae bacterium]